MSLGRPPSSSRPSRDTDPRLDAARGLVRDALGSLSNLEQLLKSLRVGPKALSAVIPDVHASCAPLLGAVRELLAALRGHLPDDVAPGALEAFIAPRVEALERALSTARRQPINARNRLALEAVVGQAAQELDAARALIDLLEEALGGPSVRVDLLELVRSADQSGERSNSEETPRVQATLAAPERSIELLVNPRLAIWLLGVGVQLVSRGESPDIPHVALMVKESECGLRVERAPAPGQTLSLATRHLIEPTETCAHAAARLGGAHIMHEESACMILWPRSPA